MRKTCADDYPQELRDRVNAWKREGLQRAEICDLVRERWPGRFDWIRNHHIDVLTGAVASRPAVAAPRGRPPRKQRVTS